jgi:hypothetical protein
VGSDATLVTVLVVVTVLIVVIVAVVVVVYIGGGSIGSKGIARVRLCEYQETSIHL